MVESAAGIDFSRFSPQATIVLLQAEEEARTLGHSYLGAEHILLALAEGPGIDSAAKILERLCVTPRSVRGFIEFALGKGTARDAEITLNPSMVRIVDIARHQAWQSGQRLITTEDILHAIVRDELNIAVSCLESLGVSTFRLHSELTQPPVPAPV